MASYKDFFARAAEEGLEALELSVTKSTDFSFGLFRNEIDSYEISDSFSLSARGIYNGKEGYASCEKMDREAIEYVIKHIKENAALSTSNDTPVIFKGSEKYQRKNVFNKKLNETSKQDKIAFVKEIDKKIKETNSLIAEVETGYQEKSEELVLMNSYGLNLKSRSNYAVIYSSAVAVDPEGETKNGFSVKIIEDLDNFNKEEFINKVIDKTISQFGSAPCTSGKYRCVFAPSAVSALLGAYLSNLSSEQVQKNASLLAGRLDEKIAGSKLTVTEQPLQKNVFFRYFDDEGVATRNKVLIHKGVLKQYLYNLKTAAKDKVESTGNGYKRGGTMGIGMVNVAVKPGRLSRDELIEKCGNGIYIDSLSGMHAGLNPQSGNFSLLSNGFMIRDGKLAEPVTLITAAGNIFDVFNSITAVGNDVEQQMNSYQVPSILIKKISISGK